ncbi:cell division protein DamX [Yokenella regensburgei]|uniref:cell division protein DamX n=1 Tax=Yokenella regensburgei TaxID=158877 RepID=UPI00024204AD|nr:cell division protein DamX [Yokenella regensburgei]EHM50396.1 protein DamX [Yokenella regensburgei ATCC 43003]
MDEYKPEDELKPDPSDRRAGRSRQSSDRENEPQINFDELDLDAEERRPTRTRNARDDEEEEYESDDESEAPVERRPRKRKSAASGKPASRQYMMMGLGILVLLLLIVGIGSALKAPSSPSTEQQTASSERSIDLSGNASEQTNGAQPAPGAAAGQTAANNEPQGVTVPPISSTPTQGQATTAPEGQQRVEVQGDLNSALTQQQGQVDNAVVNSTLPTEPATVAPVRNGAAGAATTAPRQVATTETAPRQATPAPRPERKHTVIESKPQTVAKAPVSEPKAVTQPKRTETVATPAPEKAPVTATPAKPAATTTAPAATATASAAAPSAAAASSAGKSAGDVGALKTAPASHYTLQLSSSSNYDNLNGWAKKENLKNYVVYQTTRNGQPWYVLVSGVYASKDDAKRAVATLPADVQAKNPWAKPLHQVQTDLK